MKIAVLMTAENIVGREILVQMGRAGIAIGLVIIEESAYAEKEKAYLQNDFYNPPGMNDILAAFPTEVIQVPHLNGIESRKALARFAPDLVLLDGSRIVKREIFSIPRLGALNSHPGLLPEFRGVDSVRWAIFYQKPVGATCHFVDEGIDTGPIVVMRGVGYEQGEKLLEIRVRTMKVGVELMREAVEGLASGSLEPVPQPKEGNYYSWAPEDVQERVDELLAKK